MTDELLRSLAAELHVVADERRRRGIIANQTKGHIPDDGMPSTEQELHEAWLCGYAETAVRYRVAG